MKKHRKISAVLMALLLGAALVCPSVFAAQQRVFDQAGLFQAAEITELESLISDLRQDWELDFVVVTTADAEGKSAQDYADDYYDYNGFGAGADKSGVLFLIDMDNREAWISTTGSAIDLYTDARIEQMLDAVFEYLPDGNYYKSAVAFLQAADRYAAQGVPDDHYRDDGENRYYYDEDGNLHYYGEKRGLTLPYVLGTIAVAVIAGGVFFLIVFMKYNRKGSSCPYPFRQQSGMQMLRSEDNYLGTTTTTRHIDTSDHGSGGSGGGGSSVHTSSSGTSHGGGGRSF